MPSCKVGEKKSKIFNTETLTPVALLKPINAADSISVDKTLVVDSLIENDTASLICYTFEIATLRRACFYICI